MKCTRVLLLLTLFVGLLVVGCSSVDDSQQNPVISEVQDHNVNLMDDDQLVAEALGKLVEIQTEVEALELINSYPDNIRESIMNEIGCEYSDSEPIRNNTAVSATIEQYNVAKEDIITVQRMVFYNGNVLIDSVDAVVTNEQWYYWNIEDGKIDDISPPSMALSTTVDIYGYYTAAVTPWWYPCQASEWVVLFLLPTCFHEISPGRFGGIIDAWASSAPCGSYNGGPCALWQCGSAWDGYGYYRWWNYHDCGTGWSRKVGKLVQKRWIYTLRNAGYSETSIAHMVRARVQY